MLGSLPNSHCFFLFEQTLHVLLKATCSGSRVTVSDASPGSPEPLSLVCTNDPVLGKAAQRSAQGVQVFWGFWEGLGP